uniref:Reverse transcriptase domain-containing protein n=1 Tax=Tanacetum cinerariifolium TaxID=118510 RepID=A0A699H9Q8_TANCI|nr:hypothetical protein [Tanacetum cinerariifolium]
METVCLRNENGDAVNDNIWGDVSRGCTYKEFLAYNYKEYDSKGGAIVYTRWIKKMKSVQDMSGCRDSQKVKYTAGSFVGKALTWWNSQIYTRGREANVGMAGYAMYTNMFYELARLVPHLVTPKGKRIERNGSIKKNHAKRGNVGEPSKDRNTSPSGIYGCTIGLRFGKACIKGTSPSGIYGCTIGLRFGKACIKGTASKCTTCSYHYSPETSCRSCFNYNCLGHFAKDWRVAPRNVNPINAKNPVARTCYECGSTDHIKSTCLKLNQAHRLGETIRTKSWLLMRGQGRENQGSRRGSPGPEHRDGFVSTTFIHLLDIETSDLGFSYKIEIASGQLVQIDKVVKECKLEIEGHVFDINLIPSGSRSFDVIIGMHWLSDHKAKIICHEKVVRIPLLDGKVLRVLGEKLEEDMRQLMSAKANEKKQEEIVVVKDFLEVFPDDLSGLPPVQEIEF